MEVGGLQIAYRQAGEGPPLFFLHGILSDSRAWRPQLEELCREFTVVAWDAPGCGGSADPPESFGAAGYADCARAFCDALGLDRPHVAGHSWGGALAQELYSRHPGLARSLILVDTYAGWRGSLPADVCEARLAGCLRESELDAAEFIPDWIPDLLTAEAPGDLREELTRVMSDFHPPGYRAMVLAFADQDTRPILPRVDIPVLLVWGEADQRSPPDVARAMDDALPDSSLTVIPRAGHYSALERPDAFNSAVRTFCAANT